MSQEDSDQQGSEDEKKEAEKKSPWRWLKRFFIVCLVIAALFIIGLMAMAAIGGNHEALKLGLEDYLSSATRMQAEINDFEEVTFYPLLEIKAGDITLTPAGQTDIAVRIDDLNLRINFWDVFFSRPRIADLNIAGINLAEGLLTPHPIYIEKLALAEDVFDGRPAIAASGTYDGMPFTAMIEMTSIRNPGEASYYTSADPGAFSVQASFLTLEGQVLPLDDGIRLDFSSILIPGQPPLSGMLDYIGDEESRWEAALKTGNSTVQAEIKSGADRLAGDIRFPVLAVSDLTLVPAIADLFAYLTLAGTDGFILPERNMALTVSAEKLMLKGVEIGTFSLPVTHEYGTLEAGPLAGALLGGELSGTMVITEHPKQAELTLDAALENADFSRLAEILYGNKPEGAQTASIALNLNGAGATGESLPLTGQVIVNTGQGKTEIPYEAIWESDIIPALAAEDETALKCLIAETFIDITDKGHPCGKTKPASPAAAQDGEQAE